MLYREKNVVTLWLVPLLPSWEATNSILSYYGCYSEEFRIFT